MLYGILFILIIFASAIETEIPLFNYWDEFATILAFFYGIYLKLNSKIKKSELKQWALLMLIISIGIMGNVLYGGIQDDSSIIIKDVLAISKFFIITYSLQTVKIKEKKQEDIIRIAAKIARILIVITFIIAIVGYVVDIGMYTGEIRLTKCFKFIFSVPTFFVSSYVMLSSVLIVESVKQNKIYLLMDGILLFLSQRTKAYAAIVMILILIILGEKKIYSFTGKVFSNKKNTMSKFKMWLIIVLFVLGTYIIGKSKIEYYLSYGLYAARPALYIVGLKIASDFFPFGSGFGTFASALSVENYSKIYTQYGIQNTFGLVEGKSYFAADVFWPCIYGQFGTIGFLIYVKMMWNIIKRQMFDNISESKKIALIFVWLYALIASVAEAYFTNSSGVQMALIISLYIGTSAQRKDMKA